MPGRDGGGVEGIGEERSPKMYGVGEGKRHTEGLYISLNTNQSTLDKKSEFYVYLQMFSIMPL